MGAVVERPGGVRQQCKGRLKGCAHPEGTLEAEEVAPLDLVGLKPGEVDRRSLPGQGLLHTLIMDLEAPDPRRQLLRKDRHLVADGEGTCPEGPGPHGAEAPDGKDAVNGKANDSIPAPRLDLGGKGGEGIPKVQGAPPGGGRDGGGGG